MGGPRHAPDRLAFIEESGAVLGDLADESLIPGGAVSGVEEIGEAMNAGFFGGIGRGAVEPELEVSDGQGGDVDGGLDGQMLDGEVEGGIEIGLGDGTGAEFGVEEGRLHEGGLASDAVEEGAGVEKVILAEPEEGIDGDEVLERPEGRDTGSGGLGQGEAGVMGKRRRMRGERGGKGVHGGDEPWQRESVGSWVRRCGTAGGGG